MKKFLLSVVLFLLAFYSYGQNPCIPTENFSPYDKGTGFWKAYVYQLDPHYSGDNVTREFSSTLYRGMLPYRPDFLPHDGDFQPLPSNNFDINFGDLGGYSTDANYFTTIGRFNEPETEGCLVQLQNFGVVFRTRINIETTGIYRITIGSDDGSFLKDANDTIHNNWGTGRTYVYEENLFNYYRAYEAGRQLNYDFSYYEKTGSNRISFNFELYFGPGEIEGDQDVCGIAPDPAPFGSRGPAAFEHDGTGVISYQWQYHDDENGEWVDIDGATGLTYKVPQYDKDHSERSWTGQRRYRRMAILSVQDAEPTATPTNEVVININPIENQDQEEFGLNRWIGHVYRGKGVFTDDMYAGRIEEAGVNFDQRFGNSSMEKYRFELVNGCYIYTTNFSVRYKMKLDVEPGTYNFSIYGDDGFRLSVNGEVLIDKWVEPHGTRDGTFMVKEPGQLELVLEYFEDKGGNRIDYDQSFLILPLEWGKVSAEACGPANCLTWETIQEKNTSHFELERSYNGTDWEMFDNSVQAQGNSTELYTYDFTDKRVMASKVYYRIKQVDLDEAYEYSEVMRVDNPYHSRSFTPFPNPTLDKIMFFSSTAVRGVSLISSDYLINKLVEPVRLHDNRYEVDLSGLRRGSYVVIIEKEGGGVDTFKVIKK